ncbi:MAG: 2,3-bisphosphoglycerate-independent phosphoglycerate mutase [Candidatus Shapirobacteria bacterium]
MINKKVILIVRDGWGYSDKEKGNAIKAANTPNNDEYISHYPTSLLKCTGAEVGNPESAQGGSEVGHLTLGAGRVVWQPQEIINRSIINGSFFVNPAFLGAIENCKKNDSDLHISGLLSDAGVHSDIDHLFALLKLAKDSGLTKVYIHVITDGRDVPEKSALGYIEKLENKIKEIGVGKIASVIGRYYTMDRDTNWDRTQVAYDLMTTGKGFSANSAREAVEMAYSRGDKTDYYIQPTVIVENNKVISLISKNDSFIWFNFRTDRSRQITILMEKLGLYYVGMCQYDEAWTLPAAFLQEKIDNNLAEVLANAGKSDLRVAETEKFAHVTFFFNSQQEKVYSGEDRIMVPSSKVASYDLKPEMSAFEVKDKVLENIGNYDFILVNFANADLVGHGGVFEATVKACEVVDQCVGEIVKLAIENDYYVIVGADHGNAEEMLYDNGEKDASHGYNPVTYSLVGKDLEGIKLRLEGGLKDVAPTILELMGIKKPVEMTGESLINE